MMVILGFLSRAKQYAYLHDSQGISVLSKVFTHGACTRVGMMMFSLAKIK
jgi:hypothetical protein